MNTNKEKEEMCGEIVSSGTGKIDGHACFNKKPCPIHAKEKECTAHTEITYCGCTCGWVKMPPTKEQDSDWEKDFDTKIAQHISLDDAFQKIWTTLHIVPAIKQFIRSLLSKKDQEMSLLADKVREEMVKKYDDIFKWLLGEKGDFPNLAEKPHYIFRTELRERLSTLSNNTTHE